MRWVAAPKALHHIAAPGIVRPLTLLQAPGITQDGFLLARLRSIDVGQSTSLTTSVRRYSQKPCKVIFSARPVARAKLQNFNLRNRQRSTKWEEGLYWIR
jgi:hypothetical protein